MLEFIIKLSYIALLSLLAVLIRLVFAPDQHSPGIVYGTVIFGLGGTGLSYNELEMEER